MRSGPLPSDTSQSEPASASTTRSWCRGISCSASSGVFISIERKPPDNPPQATSQQEPNFSISTYPQLSLNNPTSSVEREVVTNGPQFLFPIEANARIGPIRIDGEVGYWFTRHDVPQSWIRGMILGYELTKKNRILCGDLRSAGCESG